MAHKRHTKKLLKCSGLSKIFLNFQDSNVSGIVHLNRFEFEQLQLQAPRRQDSKRAREPWLETYKSVLKKYIETTIGEISKLFSKKIHATTLNSFFAENRFVFIRLSN